MLLKFLLQTVELHFRLARGRNARANSVENCLVCPMSKGKHLVKLLFKKKQAQREGNFISRLNICLEI
jgi:hypothetical protein